MKHHEKENIIDYANIFEQSSDILKYSAGPDVL